MYFRSKFSDNVFLFGWSFLYDLWLTHFLL